MKTARFIGMALFMALFAVNFTACSDDDPVKEEPKAPEISVPAGETDYFQSGMNMDTRVNETNLTFTATADWNISVAETRNGSTWCTVVPSSGKAGKNTVKVMAEENTTFDARNVVLTVTAGTAKKTISVTQKQKDALTLTQNKFEVGPKGGEIKVEVKANVDYQVAIAESALDWITQSKSSRGLTSTNVVFKIAESDEAVKREGEIVIKGGSLLEIIHVYQAGQKVLLLSKNAFQVAAKGETVKVEIKSNFTYGVKMPKVDWIAEAKGARATSSHTLYYEVKANETYDARSAEIIFFDKDSKLADTLKISQDQKAGFMLAEKEVSLGAAGGEFKVGVSANIAYDVAVDADWITKVNARGLTTENLTFSAKENTSDKIRYAKITFTDKSKAVLGTVLVSQGVKSKGGKKLVELKMTEYLDSTPTEVFEIDIYQFVYDSNGRLVKSIDIWDESDGNDPSHSYFAKQTTIYTWEKDKIVSKQTGEWPENRTWELQNGLVKKSYCISEGNFFVSDEYVYAYTALNRLKSKKAKDCGSTLEWSGDAITKVFNDEYYTNGEVDYRDMIIPSYKGNQTCKGYLPLACMFHYYEDLCIAHPELFGLSTNLCPSSLHEIAESSSHPDENGTLDHTFTYKFDKEGYVIRCEMQTVEKSGTDTYSYLQVFDFVWE